MTERFRIDRLRIVAQMVHSFNFLPSRCKTAVGEEDTQTADLFVLVKQEIGLLIKFVLLQYLKHPPKNTYLS